MKLNYKYSLLVDCTQDSLRLVGSTPRLGRLEICHNHAWGTVCNNEFGELDAMVACRQLGYSPIGTYALTCNYFYILSYPIKLCHYHMQ